VTIGSGETEQSVVLTPETASDRAVRYLRAMIFSGQLRAGDRLPPERDLGAHLGISRMTLRLALKVLESTGYIVTTRGSQGGSRVSDTDELYACWYRWMAEHHDELSDIFEFRLTVEGRLAALAAERRTDADLEVMERAAAHERTPQDWSSLFRTDMDIHNAIARAARSPRLERAMLESRAELFTPVDLSQLEQREYEVHETHLAIIEAVRARDAAASAALMADHVRLIRRLIDRAWEAADVLKPGSR
jgi:DNA-binding FadR family transcriptional regulator